MTRRLPWARTFPVGASGISRNGDAAARGSPSTPASTSKTSVDSPPTRIKTRHSPVGIDEGDMDADNGSEHEELVATPSATPRSEERAGSTSPPPAPLRGVYMRDGIDADDAWRMVEDEFLATAQQFTAHLHAAEYQRLKSASKSQNATAIKNISRPVVGRMTDLVRMKQERKAQSVRNRREKQERKRRRLQGGVDGGGDGDEQQREDVEDDDSDSAGDPYSSTSLVGLMQKPRKTAALLDPAFAATVANASSSARPMPLRTSPHRPRVLEGTPQPTFKSIPGLRAHSARKARPVEQEDDDTTGSEEDDLDKPFQPTAPRRISGLGGSSTVVAAAKSSPQPAMSKTNKRPNHKKPAVGPAAVSAASRSVSVKKSDSTSASGSEDDDILTRLKNRRASHKASRNEHRLDSG
ncbi:hypothetical protein Micbo1qcDRAFT_192608 [Microdochium bolleyi]|uniref:Uncharacterized protein n=1 Tax=Microdochium bolleyi TaxID=196109 RepID=A0A136JET9_9PEZI|nr:hypothetical protein Micbo1qcDRAFT_192608 [Microdochium bolleyi]